MTALVGYQGGRRFTASRRVRLADVGVDGCLRLDALARWLQDVAADDVRDLGLDGITGWVVRRTTLEVLCRPRFEDVAQIVTWCSGLALAWTERRTTVLVDGVACIEAGTVWVAVDAVTLRPGRVPTELSRQYRTKGTAKPDARLRHQAAPARGEAHERPWDLRQADFDPYGHLNNAAAWQAVEQAAPSPQWPGPLRAELEYRAAVLPDASLRLLSQRRAEQLFLWLVTPDDAVAVSGRLTSVPPSAPGPASAGGAQECGAGDAQECSQVRV